MWKRYFICPVTRLYVHWSLEDLAARYGRGEIGIKYSPCVLFGTAFARALRATLGHPFLSCSTPVQQLITAHGGFMYANHRTTPRFNLKIPVRIRGIDQSGSTEYTVLSSNVSAGGVYFASELHFEPGIPVRMYFTVPEPIFGKPAARWCCEGRVIYTLLTDHHGNGLAGGISFQTHTLLTAARLKSMNSRITVSVNGVGHLPKCPADAVTGYVLICEFSVSGNATEE
jgi:hypothetical protein